MTNVNPRYDRLRQSVGGCIRLMVSYLRGRARVVSDQFMVRKGGEVQVRVAGSENRLLPNPVCIMHQTDAHHSDRSGDGLLLAVKQSVRPEKINPCFPVVPINAVARMVAIDSTII